MTGAIKRKTPNFGLNIVNYDFPRWHTFEWQNLDTLDAVLAAAGLTAVRGVWENSTEYKVGDRVVDGTSSSIWICAIEHISSLSGTFGEDRAAHPTYWRAVSSVPVDRGNWVTGVIYNTWDIVKYNNAYYAATVAHTSTIFVNDLSNGKWSLIIDLDTVNDVIDSRLAQPTTPDTDDYKITTPKDVIRRVINNAKNGLLNSEQTIGTVLSEHVGGGGTTYPTKDLIQNVLDNTSVNGQSVNIGVGDYTVSSPIVSGEKAVKLIGMGQDSTRLISSSPINIIEHGLTGVNLSAQLALSGLSINAAADGPHIAVKAKFDERTGGFFISDVEIGSWNANYGFDKYIYAEGATNTSFSHFRFNGSTFGTDAERINGTQIGLHFVSTSNTNRSFDMTFFDGWVDAEKHAFFFEVLGAPGDSGSIEGVTLDKIRGRSNTDAWFKYTVPNSPAWRAPFISMIRCNYQGAGACAHVDGVEHFTMDDCWQAQDAPLTGSPTDANMMQFTNVRGIRLINSTIHLLTDASLQHIISVESGCESVLIDNLTIVCDGVPTLSGGIFIDPTVTDVNIGKITWINWPAGVPKFAYPYQEYGVIKSVINTSSPGGISVFDSMTDAEIVAVQSGSGAVDVSAALQTSITNIENRTLLLPAGVYLVNTGLILPDDDFIIQGSGSGKTIILFNEAAGTTISSTLTNKQRFIKISGVTIRVKSGCTADKAIDFEFPTTTSIDQIQVDLSDDFVIDRQSTGIFSTGLIRLENVTNARLDGVMLEGSGIDVTGYGISFEGQCLDTYVGAPRIYLVGDAIKINGTSEGVTVIGMTAVSVKRGVVGTFSGGEPGINVHSSHINARDCCVDISNGLQVSIKDNLLYAATALGTMPGWSAVKVAKSGIGTMKDVQVSGNIIHGAGYTGNRIGVNIDTDGLVNVNNNIFYSLDTGIVGSSTATSIRGGMNNYSSVTNNYSFSASNIQMFDQINGQHAITSNGASVFRLIGDTFAALYLKDTAAATNSKLFRIIVDNGILQIAMMSDDESSAKSLFRVADNVVSLGGSVGQESLRVLTVTNSVNFIQSRGAVTTQSPIIEASGSDTNVNLSIRGKGTGIPEILGDTFRITSNKTPTNASASGTKGDICWDDSYIYVCIATNTWKRVAIATW